MSKLAEDTLVRLLPDDESLTHLAKEGVDLEIISNPDLRDIVAWAITYYRNGNKAPSITAIADRFSDVLSDNEIDLEDEPEETIEWVVEQIKGTYARSQAQKFNRSLAEDMSEAEVEDRVQVLEEKAAELMSVVQRLQTKRARVDLRTGAGDMLASYDSLVQSGNPVYGLTFGLPAIDMHTKGTHDGELCIVAGAPKAGKSFFVDRIALKNWEAGGTPALYTLENSIEMTQQRLASMALGLSLQELMDGELSETDYKQMREWIEYLEHAKNPLHIISPDSAMRNPQAIVAQAKALGADSLIIDQLTFLEPAEKQKGDSRAYDMRRILHDLKSLISTGTHQMPCVLAHQVNREGVKAAEKTGAVSMYHMADASEVERTADMLFSLWASHDQRVTDRMTMQLVVARRIKPKSYELHWSIDVGKVGVLGEIEPE